MATGDAGAAAGLETITSAALVIDTAARVNKKADEIAAVKADLAAEIAARTAADALKLDVAKIKIQTGTPTYVEGTIWFKPV